MPGRRADVGGQLAEVAPATAAAPAPSPAPAVVLPEAKVKVGADLKDRMIMIYGPEGVGKSTLASQFGDFLFFECEPGLVDLEVYRLPIGSWDDFRHGVAEVKKHPGRYEGYVIDTYDALTTYCRGHVNERLGIQHESDAEYGKGWDALSTELALWTARLASLPGGLLVIAHSQEQEVKSRNQAFTKTTPALGKSARRVVTELADMVLLLDFDESEGEERRVIRTKPSRYWDAKERGNPPRLPAQIEWPLGAGFEVLQQAWDQGKEK